MPAGPEPLGFAYFVAAKYAGYTAYCRWAIQSHIPSSEDAPAKPVMSVWLAGGLRTLIGVVLGALIGIAFWKIPAFARNDAENHATILFFSLLIPIRVGKWWLLLRLAYQNHFTKGQKTAIIFGGIGTSFVLDAIGLISAFVLPGGMWVC